MKQKRILLADDEVIFLKVTSDLLRENGYICDCASDSETVMELLRSNDYDLLISDIRMPGNSDLELIRNISKIVNDMPVILVTAFPSIDNTIQALKFNVRDYLIKPIDFDELLMMVKKIITTNAVRNDVAKEVRKSISRWRLELDKVEGILNNASKDVSPETLNYYMDITFKNIFDVLMNFRNITKMMVVGNDEQPTNLFNTQGDLKGILEDTVNVLKKTKSSFKSKDIGELRKKLESVLAGTSQNLQIVR